MSAGLPCPAWPADRRVPIGTRCGPGVSLAQSSTGSAATLPTTDPTALLTVVGDIRLDDRTGLLASLGRERPLEVSDHGLVLAAYRRWGDRCVEHLVGDFAFALWDGRRHQFTCARDPFGTKPFYYHLSSATFAFASDPEAVLRLPSVPRRLNPVALVDYLTTRYEDTEVTAWLDVLRLSPGSSIVVGCDRVRRQRFWHPESISELRLGSDADYEEAFRVALSDAVGARLETSGVGVSLSGGLDSSSVACVARPLYRGGRLTTFSAVFDLDPGSDEREYAAAAAAQAGAEARYVRPEDTTSLTEWAAAPWTGPAPSCSPQLAITRSVTGSAIEHGVSVLLTGVGGDSVVSHGAAYLTELAGSGHPGKFLIEARALARRHRRPLGHVVQKYGLRPFVPEAVIRARRARGHLELGIAGVPAPVRPEVLRTLGFGAAARELPRRLPRTARLDHLADLTSCFSPYALEDAFHTDVVTGVERRYPFFDRRLAELCLSLPGDQKLRDGWSRSIMRRALVGVLPEVVRQRVGKSDLTDPFLRGLLGPDRPILEAVVASPGSITDWVDPVALTRLWQRCLSERKPADCFTMWRVAVLSRWLDYHGFT
ncbi:MAG: hypothetical protein QOH36_307 [Actinomycetota bacterium]|nr:hypothetical protein [Actinomycetota bacterium]